MAWEPGGGLDLAHPPAEPPLTGPSDIEANATGLWTLTRLLPVAGERLLAPASAAVLEVATSSVLLPESTSSVNC